MADSFKLADIGLGGQLEAMLQRWNEQGVSLRDMRDRLGQLGIEVSHEQIRRWCQRVGIDTTRKAASA